MASEASRNYECKLYRNAQGVLYCVREFNGGQGLPDDRLLPVNYNPVNDRYQYNEGDVHSVASAETEVIREVDYNNENWIELDFTLPATFDEAGCTKDYITNIGKRFSNNYHSKYIYRLYGETDFTTSDEWGPYNFHRESSAVQYTEAYAYGNGYVGPSAYLARADDGEWALFQPVL